MGNLQRNQARDEHIIVLPHMREVSRIAAPQAHAILLKEPCGQAAELPLRADVRRRPQYYP